MLREIPFNKHQASFSWKRVKLTKATDNTFKIDNEPYSLHFDKVLRAIAAKVAKKC